ncbi:MAG: hypothetical protein V4439_03495 [Patescibacteria group bacterium]
MDLTIVPQTNFLPSNINDRGSKFLRFDLKFKKQKHSVIRIGKTYADDDSHAEIFYNFLKELKEKFSIDQAAAISLIRKYGGGRLKKQKDSVFISEDSIDYGEEGNREFTKEILEKNLSYKFFIQTWH